MTVGVFVLYFFRTLLIEAYIANIPFAKSSRTLSVIQHSIFLKKYILCLCVFNLARNYFPYLWGNRRYALCSKVHCAVYPSLQSSNLIRFFVYITGGDITKWDISYEQLKHLVKVLVFFADFCIYIFLVMLTENVLLCLRSVLRKHRITGTCEY